MLSTLDNAAVPHVRPAGMTVRYPIPAVPLALAPVAMAPITALLGSMLVQYLGAFR